MPFSVTETRNSFLLSPDKNEKGEKTSLLKKQGSIASLEIG